MSTHPAVAAGTPRYIAIEGAIGAGKTTLATMLAGRLNGKLVLERFEENPFLPDFYRDPRRYAFQTQIFFLLSRYRQQQELPQLDLFHDYHISDYLFDKDRIFASLTLDDQELALYDTVVQALEANVAAPDLVVYLRSDIDRLIANIRRRGRGMEQAIDPEYLRDLSEAYSRFFAAYTAAPILIVNTARVDIVKDSASFDRLLEEILSPAAVRLRFFPSSP